MPQRGHLYWASLDRRRPVLIVSTNVRNALASDVIVVPCTTRLVNAPTHVRLQKGDGGVPAASVLKCEQITTLHKDEVGTTPLGRCLSQRQRLAVERAILRAIGVPVPLDTGQPA